MSRGASDRWTVLLDYRTDDGDELTTDMGELEIGETEVGNLD